MRTTTMRSKLLLLFMTFVMMLALPAMALADVIKNDVVNDLGVGGVRDYTAGASATTVNYWIHATGNEGCDAQDGSKATVKLSAKDPAGNPTTAINIQPSSRIFSLCGEANSQAFSFSTAANLAPGKYEIVSHTTDFEGTYNDKASAFYLRVNAPAPPAPPENTAPVVATDAQDVRGDEGQTLQNNGSFSDANGDTLTITKSAGEGTVTQGANGSWSWSLPTTDNGSGSVTVTATDGKGGIASDSFNWTAYNVAPSVTLTGPANVNESQTDNRTYNFTIDDPGTADTHTVDSKSCGANGTEVSATNSSIVCNFPDGTKTSVVSVSVSDNDRASGSDSKSVSIANVAPVLSNLQITGANQTACLTGGNNVSISFDVTDPGADSFTRSVNWGDGNTDALLSHNYANAGSYLIEVGGTDGEDNAATLAASNRVSLTYNMSTSLLAPVNLNGSSVFKYGSTIPLKIRVLDCNSTPVSGLSPAIKIQKMSASTPTDLVNEATSTSAADTTGFMRYDSSAGQYIYNLASRSLPDPEATYRAVVSEGSSTPNSMTSQNFGIRK